MSSPLDKAPDANSEDIDSLVASVREELTASNEHTDSIPVQQSAVVSTNTDPTAKWGQVSNRRHLDGRTHANGTKSHHNGRLVGVQSGFSARAAHGDGPAKLKGLVGVNMISQKDFENTIERQMDARVAAHVRGGISKMFIV